MNFFGGTLAFAFFYVLLMLPMYYLPFQGPDYLTASDIGGLSPYLNHLAAFFVLIGVTWARGAEIKQEWIVVFPILAGVFDVMPLFSTVPYAMTLFHAAAIVVGVSLPFVSGLTIKRA